MKDQKMGRNPFGAKAATPKKSEIPTVENVEERESSLKDDGPRLRKPREPKRGEMKTELLSLVLNWKLERFSFLRFERGAERSSVDLLSISLTHPKWRKTGTYRLVLPLGGRRLSLGVLSARVQKL